MYRIIELMRNREFVEAQVNKMAAEGWRVIHVEQYGAYYQIWFERRMKQNEHEKQRR